MQIKIKRNSDPLPSEITSESTFLKRRDFLVQGAAGALALSSLSLPESARAIVVEKDAPGALLEGVRETQYKVDEKLTPYDDVASYNNFYEFGTGKRDPAKYAHTLTTSPWTVKVLGECEKPGDYDLEDILKQNALEERIYRFRCVEAWSMVVPWIGISLADVLKQFKPTSKAKYVAFRTLFRPSEMPGQKTRTLEWPYVEGLRIDEAMHPLSMLVTGMYGRTLPNQNGAPLRLMVPWKYGFKSIKSIVTIRFTEEEPPTSWNISIPNEYGFYSNVNPKVNHPRWSQRRERRIGEIFKRETLMFNGYEEEVASLYAGMDLKKYF